MTQNEESQVRRGLRQVELKKNALRDAEDVYDILKLTMGGTTEAASLAAWTGNNWSVIIDKSIDWVVDKIKSAWEAIKDIFSSLWEWLKDFFFGLFS
jgi:hypothetical protein